MHSLSRILLFGRSGLSHFVPTRRGLALLTFLMCVRPLGAAVLIPQNATWQYLKGTAEASSPTSAWRELSFSDSGWLTGPMPFFYGEALAGGTQLTDMRYTYGCVFLRKTFQVTDLPSVGGLDLIASCDDGFVAWINGHPVQRYNVAANKGSYTDFADSAAPEPVAATRYLLPDHRDYLVAGANVLAVQLYNVSLTSSDIVLDLQLVSVEPDATPPVQVGFSPPAGDVPALSQVMVVFSEPVFGVDEGDLLLNGARAISVAASAGTSYTFTYDPQPFGPVLVTWNPQHGIIDLARPGNAFDSSGPGTSWQYRVVDDVAPTLIQQNPLAGRTVRRLGQVELTFSEPVTGLDPGDLVVNGQPATNVTGISAGPYVFQFAAITNGPVQIDWRPGHGIQDLAEAPNPFIGFSWTYTVDPASHPGQVMLSEFLALNETSLRDEDGEAQDWIEIQNRGDTPVNLEGWSLTDDPRVPGQWTFPAITLGARQYLVVFASGKDRRPVGTGARLHTNFKLSAVGEYLGLYTPESPREVADELAPEFPEQRIDHSYARQTGTDDWRYFRTPTPGTANGSSSVEGLMPSVHFSVSRGFFNTPFNLILAVDAPDALIRYTLDHTPPTETGGLLYTGPIHIDRTSCVRAAAFGSNRLPSSITTHTYFYGQSSAIRSLPAFSLVTAQSNLFGPTGIMEVNPRNTTRHGIAWERPVSVEYIQPLDHQGFDLEAGLRIQGGGYVRERYDPEGSLPYSKYSFRLYFRGDYGASRLEFPLFPDCAVSDFDKVVLRAGMNDHSNPFVCDELVRRLFADMGQVSSHGTITTFFLNGVYKGYYNPCERIDSDFLRSWHGGGSDWDLIAQFGEIQEGDTAAWNALRSLASTSDLSVNAAYQEVARRLDLTNFVDYLLVCIYPAMGDWPHNNWRVARERVPGARFRYYVWDAEWSFGYRNGVSHNMFANELSTSTDIATFYQKLHANPEFRLLFADRIHKHFFNGGALTDARVQARFNELRTNMAAILPGMNTSIQTTWVPQRRGYLMQHFTAEGLFASANAPVFSQHGGRVRRGFDLTLSAPAGTIYYTTNGADPRTPFTGAISADAQLYTGAPLSLDRSLVLRARTWTGSDWSALTEAAFAVAEIGPPLRFTEIMYHPPDGDAFEFIELFNAGAAPFDLSLLRFVGVEFQFADNTFLAPGSFLVLASDDDPTAFAARYPGLRIAGYFSGSLSNGGEKLALVDTRGCEIGSVTYNDRNGWPANADGQGYSLEVVDPNGDPNAPANWRASLQLGGSPGATPAVEPHPSGVVLNELMAENLTAVTHAGSYPDWVELFNGGSAAANLDGWRLRDEGNEFVFPTGTTLSAGQYLVVWCDTNSAAAGLHTGFNLGRSGDSLLLEDSTGRRVDALSFGLQVTDLALGRFGNRWSLAQPTPGAVNTDVPLASQTSVHLNEWLADSPPGGDDWIELFNADASRPASLRDLGFTTSAGAAFQYRALSFIPAGGHVLLYADEQPGPNHLGFKLPAAGTILVLYDETGIEVDRVTVSALPQGVSAGRLPDGAVNIVSFPATLSPGAANYLANYSGPVLNEILARNDTATTNAAGRFGDWIELHNPNPTAFDLSGMRLSREREDSAPWFFPSGSSIPGDGYLVVWFDNQQAASTTLEPELHTGHGLSAEGGGVFLFTASGQLVDSIEFGVQAANLSIGRSGGVWRLLVQPTPGAPNAAPASLGSTAGLRLNEWMADPVRGSDWFELYNPDSLPVQLGGLHLSDDPSIIGVKKHRIPDLSFIAARGWVKWVANGSAADAANHVNFRLSRLGQTLRLNTAAGALIDGVDIYPQAAGVSDGRLPDGSSTLLRFVITPTPESANYLPHPGLVVNEVLSHSDPPLEDAIELLNLTDSPIELGGYYLSDDPASLKKFQIPAGTVIGPQAFRVFYEHQFNGGAGSLVPFSLNSARGDMVHLSEPDPAGEPTGYRAVAEFGPSANGVSFGRFPTIIGWDFAALEATTFGVSQPSSVAEFRTGTGAPNTGPRVGPVVVSEILYHPVLTAGPPFVEADDDEFVELENPGPDPVPLYDVAHPQNTWRLNGGIEFSFPTGIVLQARSRLLVVNIDPIADSTALTAFRARYGVPPMTPIFGPFAGRLANEGDTVGLYRPDPPQPTPGPDAGLVPYVLVERINYANASPWTEDAYATGLSLQRQDSTQYGNDPVNWLAALPTAGSGLPTLTDSDGDGLPDDWETAHGLDKQDPTDADEDPDQDGLTNRQEFVAGTDPRNPSSRLQLEAVWLSPVELLLRFEAAAERSYSVHYRDALGAAPWQKLADLPASATPGIMEVPDSLLPDASRFYRLVTPAQP